MKSGILYAIGFVLTISVPQAVAQGKTDESSDSTQVKPEGEKAEKEKKEDKKKGKSFDEVVKDFQAIDGLFRLYHNPEDNKVFLELTTDQLDKIFLCSISREVGDGTYFDSAAMIGRFPFIFKRVGEKILFIHKNVYFRADKDTAIHRAVVRGVANSIVGSAKIESRPHTERGSILVNPSGFFVQDIAMVGHIFNEYIKSVKYNFDKENSYFEKLKSFSGNTEIEVALHFVSSNPKPSPTIPDPRSFQHVYHYSLSNLPQSDYRPRAADDRIGHFLTMYQDYNSVLRDTPYIRNINRWHLKKAEPGFRLSPPRKPITFWLENTIPVEFREPVREGVLLWNKAFERIGFKAAIEVKQQPDDADWDPADASYNTVRWMVRPGGGYAIGPSHTDPFTGQIYDADIRVSADILRYVFMGYEELVKPVAVGDSITSGIPGTFSSGRCDLGVGVAQQAAFGWNLLNARGIDVDSEKFVRDFLVMLIAHEVGHTLGLRHNFKASTIHLVDLLQNRKFTQAKGISGSVMDYNPANIAPEGKTQGDYFQTMLGPYDYWAIEYAYKQIDAESPESEKGVLEKVASRGTEPSLPYGTDEDALWGSRGIDPETNRWDLGSDPIAFYRSRIRLARELWRKMESVFEKGGGRYPKFRRVFNRGFDQYRVAVMNVTKFIGGIYHRRDHIGDPNGRVPFEPVPAVKQREALEFLIENVLSRDAFDFPPRLLNKLAPERFWDFSGTVFKLERIDYPIHEVVLSVQSDPLNRLFDPVRLRRMQDIQLRYDLNHEPFEMREMFEGLRQTIWSELSNSQKINSFRRALQREHLDRLIGLVVDPAKGIPQDATTLARADLISIKDNIDPVLAGPEADPFSRAHLEETRAKIEAALQAGIHRRIGLN